jgi:hypothetical protein
VSSSSLPTGVIGGVLATLLMTWLVTRAIPAARLRSGRYVVEYRLPVKIAGRSFLAIGFFIAYAASRASADQRVLAACVGGTLLLISLYVFLEAQFARVEFDDEFIYTFSPWRKRRVIPWCAVAGYSYSAVNRWHSQDAWQWLSPFERATVWPRTMREKWESVLHHKSF